MVGRLYSSDDVYICNMYYNGLPVHVVKEWQGINAMSANLPPEKPKHYSF